jgi:class 3 adenylate cyclase
MADADKNKLAVHDWLLSLGLGHYADAFHANDIDLATLQDLTTEDLIELGVRSVGHRRKILSAAALLASQTGDLVDKPLIIPVTQDKLSENTSNPVLSNPVLSNLGSSNLAQRRQTTMFFSDLVGFTKLVGRLDAEIMHELLGAYKEVCASVIARNGGHVIQYLGDGVLAAFGYPRAQGDDSARAVKAGLELVQAVARLKTLDGDFLSARVGMATGVVVTGQLSGKNAVEREMLVGEAPNLAARLQAEAEPGQVLMADSTASLIGRQFHYEAIGARLFKGIQEPVPVFHVLSENRTESRFESRLRVATLPMVGRIAEMNQIRACLVRAEQGHGGVVTIVGEAGIGKSRLVAEIMREAAIAGRPRLLFQTSAQNTGSPFFAIIRYIEFAADVMPDEADPVRLAKVAALIREHSDVSGEQLALLANLLGIQAGERQLLRSFSPREIRQRTIATLVRLMRDIAMKGALIVIEDLQWIDLSTREFLEAFIPCLDSLPSLVIVTMRNSGTHDLKGTTDQFPDCVLDRIEARDVRDLVASIIPESQLNPVVMDAIVARSDGVPIYAEELAYAVRESGSRLQSMGETERLNEVPATLTEVPATLTEVPATLTEVPATLTEALLARLDVLLHGQETLQYAAAVGNEIPLSFLIAVSTLSPDLVMTGVNELVGARILSRHQTSAGDTIVFRQALVRDCAYGLILRRDKQRIHSRIADVVIRQFPEWATTKLDFIPLQRELAGQDNEAIEAWRFAAKAANSSAAVGEAVAHFSRALDLCLKLPPGRLRDELELTIRTEIAFPMMALRSYLAPELPFNTDRAMELAVLVCAKHRIVPVLAAKWTLCVLQQTVKDARHIATKIVEAARDGGDIETLLLSRVLSTQAMFEGHHGDAIGHFKVFKKLYKPELHEQLLIQQGATNHAITVDMGLATSMALLGRMDEARRYSHIAISAARDNHHLNTICQTLVAAGGFCAALDRNADDLETYADELSKITVKYDLPMWRYHADLFKGLAGAFRGDFKTGMIQARHGINAIIAVKSIARTAWLSFYAQAAEEAGDLGELERTLGLSKELIEGGECWFQPEYYRLAGLLQHHRGGRISDVRHSLGLARGLAARQGAVLFERRAVDDLDRLDGRDV